MPLINTQHVIKKIPNMYILTNHNLIASSNESAMKALPSFLDTEKFHTDVYRLRS